MKPKYILLCLLLFMLFSRCGKEEPPDQHENDPVEFISLITGRDVIFTEDTTRISATATGYELSYLWSVEKGDLLGSGPEITFVATPCTVGGNEIFCTVKSSNGKEKTKSVVVTVL